MNAIALTTRKGGTITMLDTLFYYLSFPFVRYALICGTLIAFCASMIGVPLVLKRYSFIGDGLSHVAFGALAVSTAVGITGQMWLVLPVTVLCAVLLLRMGQNAKIKGDAAIAMLSVGALAFGYLCMHLFSESANVSGDVCSTLFGSIAILTLSKAQVWLCAALSLLVAAAFVLFYHKIFSVTFDESFTRACGLRASLYQLLLAVLIALVVVLAMNLVGSLLISALLIFPALCAMRLFGSFKAVVIGSASIGTACALFGILFAVLFSTPVGATVVAANALCFGVCTVVSKVKK